MVSSTALACVHTCAAMEESAVVTIEAFTQPATKPGPPRPGALNTPVSRAPTIPPMPCTPNTSSESSAPSSFLRPLTPHRQAKPPTRPITRAPPIPTLPAAGGVGTRPGTAPPAAPPTDALPPHDRAPRPRHSGVDVHHGTASEVQSTPLPDLASLAGHGVGHFLGGVGVRAHPEPH